MKTKLVTRFYCDFCRKAYMVRAVMVRHEKSCVKNPDRVCDLCAEAGVDQPALADLLAAAQRDIEPVEQRYNADPSDENCCAMVEPNEVRIAANGCPACMLAAIAQTKADFRFEFNFLAEKNRFWEQQFGPEETHG